MHRNAMRPSPLGPTFMIEVMSFGAFGAQPCQASKTWAARDRGSVQDTPKTTARATGTAPIENCVTTPKLPPPPPRQAQ